MGSIDSAMLRSIVYLYKLIKYLLSYEFLLSQEIIFGKLPAPSQSADVDKKYPRYL